tara:strand:+ start:5131 stop:5391 length:261 start_codon:yes stop_codon:yes gene_type:complete
MSNTTTTPMIRTRNYESYIQQAKDKAMEDPNLHQTIKDMIVTTVANNCEWDTHQHYREILDDIIYDLQQYADTLPTAEELFSQNKL